MYVGSLWIIVEVSALLATCDFESGSKRKYLRLLFG